MTETTNETLSGVITLLRYFPAKTSAPSRMIFSISGTDLTCVAEGKKADALRTYNGKRAIISGHRRPSRFQKAEFYVEHGRPASAVEQIAELVQTSDLLTVSTQTVPANEVAVETSLLTMAENSNECYLGPVPKFKFPIPRQLGFTAPIHEMTLKEFDELGRQYRERQAAKAALSTPEPATAPEAIVLDVDPFPMNTPAEGERIETFE